MEIQDIRFGDPVDPLISFLRGKKSHRHIVISSLSSLFVSGNSATPYLLVLNAGNGWEWGNAMTIIIVIMDHSPHSLLSTSQLQLAILGSGLSSSFKMPRYGEHLGEGPGESQSDWMK